jgi:hypothetical protein
VDSIIADGVREESQRRYGEAREQHEDNQTIEKVKPREIFHDCHLKDSELND